MSSFDPLKLPAAVEAGSIERLSVSDSVIPSDRVNFEFFEFEASATSVTEIDANTKQLNIFGSSFFSAEVGDVLLALVQTNYTNVEPVTTYDFSFNAENYTDWVQVGNTKDLLAREPPLGGGSGTFRGAQFFTRVWQAGDENGRAGFRILTDLGVTGGNFDATLRVWTIRGADPSRIEIASSLVNVAGNPDIVWPAVSRSWSSGTFDVRFHTSDNAGFPDIPGYTTTGSSSGLDSDSELQFREEPNSANPIAAVSLPTTPEEYVTITLAIGATDVAVNDALSAAGTGSVSDVFLGESRSFGTGRRGMAWGVKIPELVSSASMEFVAATFSLAAQASGSVPVEVYTRVIKVRDSSAGVSGFLSSWRLQGTATLDLVAGQSANQRFVIGPFDLQATLFQQASDLQSESVEPGDILSIALVRDADADGVSDTIQIADTSIIWS